LYGMPRRIYTYDAGQGWEVFNAMSTYGTYFLVAGLLIFAYNFLVVGRRGEIAGNDPWGAPTLEWSIPSPPPEYNFARIPKVTSRLPLWDLKSPALNAEVPHSERGDTRVDVDVGTKHAGHNHGGFVGNLPRQAAESVMHIEEATGKSAKDLGIPMPNQTIKPLICAAGMTIMFTGLLFIHMDKMSLAIATMLTGALIMTFAFYAWVLTPLEDHH